MPELTMTDKVRAQMAKAPRATVNLDTTAVSLLRLTRKGMNENDGWAKVSKIVWPVIDAMPCDLIERQRHEDGSGLARLTARAEVLLDYL
jgi:hypothetical protein